MQLCQNREIGQIDQLGLLNSVKSKTNPFGVSTLPDSKVRTFYIPIAATAYKQCVTKLNVEATIAFSIRMIAL